MSESSFAGAGKGGPKKAKKEAPSFRTPQVVDKRCKVCSQPEVRGYIDRMLVAGVSVRDIADFYSQVTDQTIHYSSVYRHQKHLDLKQRVLRRIVEKRIRDEDTLTDDATGDLLHRRSMLEAVAHEGFSQILDQRVRFTVGEWNSIMETIDRMDREEEQESVVELKRELIALVTALKQSLGPAQYDQIMREYEVQLGGRALEIGRSKDDDIAAEMENVVDAEWSEDSE